MIGQFLVEESPNARAKCKKSKVKIEKGEIRIGKIVKNPFHEDSTQTQWFKVEPFFEGQLKARKTTKTVQSTSDLIGYDNLDSKGQEKVTAALQNYLELKDKPKPKKPRAKKRKGASDESEKKETKPQKKLKKEKVKKEEVKDLFADADPTCSPKEATKILKGVAKSLEFPLPEDEVNASIRCGQCLMGNKVDGKFDFNKALKALAEELRCPEKIPGAKVKAKKKRNAPEANMKENMGIVESFWELASFEFKDMQNKMKGIAYQKVARAVAGLDYVVTNGSILAKKGPKKVAGIGKVSGMKIDEFLETGKIERLERYKKGDFEPIEKA
eukprot:CAMPEP_0167765264 /NCGR_PEP_ID=MMETSP0110_2-20121227/14573_1 /TAXON_ID=629695 /ORGANISM="Gymnochlora sp., Strain CCMP2014" /LENGTH=327 /DNA_ID=CAMNT_0007652923 /DNA_START=70 /DNA_END=1053 /DNA_ORIENTATION=-